MENLFSLKSISYHYPDGAPAIEDLSLQIEAGEKVAILGANGSGKSTLLKVLDGLYSISGGEYFFRGREIDEEYFADEHRAHEFRRQVGLVFQDADVQLFCPTVWDEVAFGPLQLGLTRAEVEDRVTYSLSLLNIESLGDRTPHKLSGGEKKKVAIASVLSMRPQVLLLDEPTANLDPRSQWQVIELLGEMNADGVTVVTATHDLDSVRQVADRAYVLDERHQLLSSGPIGGILADEDLLTRANLMHEHLHKHGGVVHQHGHIHHGSHDHQHSQSGPMETETCDEKTSKS